MIWDIDDLAALKGAGVPVIPHTLTVKSPKKAITCISNRTTAPEP